MKRWKFIMCYKQIRTLICCLIMQRTWSLTIDNELVSARNDCFERVALEAMIPFEKTFETEDTNSLRLCQEICLQEGDKCQSMSFGVHRRGNGTCQLSEEKFKSGSRPNGVIFDPDFDLYVRKTNCFDLSDNNLQDQPNGYSSNVLPTTPVLLPSRPSDDTPILLVETTSSVMNTLQDESISYVTPATSNASSDSTTIFTEVPPTTYDSSNQNAASSAVTNGDRLYFSQDVYPLYKFPTLYEPNYPAPNQEAYIPGGYAANAQEIEHLYRPSSYYKNVRPTSHYNSPLKPIFGLGYGTGYGYSQPELYNQATMRPSVYNSQISPNTNRDSSKPTVNENTNRDPYRLDSYDNDYRVKDPYSYYDTTLASAYYPIPYNGQNSSSIYDNSTNIGALFGHRPYNEHNAATTYGKRPNNEQFSSPGISEPTHTNYGTRITLTQRPRDFTEFSNRPDDASSSAFINNDIGFNITTVSTHDGSYHDDKYINTYFNPEDYLMDSEKRTGLYGDANSPDYNRLSMTGLFKVILQTMRMCLENLQSLVVFSIWNIYIFVYASNPEYDISSTIIIIEDSKACFRRVLAGKRIAPHWVRRTISCERVEECMRECGREKRFTCEGFNYRLDPSGHGQGDCELIELPLPNIDLYSNPNRRDSNLLRHPDYDYYERDRNAQQNCRYNVCKECNSKLPLVPPPPHYNNPSRGWNEKPFKDEQFFQITSPYSSSATYYGKPSSSSSSLEDYPASHGKPSYSYEHQSGSYELSSHDSSYYENPPSSYDSSGSSLNPIDRYDVSHSDSYIASHPSRWEGIPSSSKYDISKHDRYGPGKNYIYYTPSAIHTLTASDSYHTKRPSSFSKYLERDHSTIVPYKKNAGKFVPYLIHIDNEWGSYGGSYGGSAHGKTGGFKGESGNEGNAVVPYSSSNYASYGKYYGFRDRNDYRHQWTRRPGPDECSVKISEGFRLHKGIVKHMYSTPSLTECERLCSAEHAFICHTYSYRYSLGSDDNCMLCDHPINGLDYYVDIEPDRDYDIYSMTDDLNVCRKYSRRGDLSKGGTSTTALADPRTTQCFFRAIDATRFYKSIVRDSLTARSVGECETECIKSYKFTCRAFAFRYGQQRHASVIDNCQLSDWPVKDMHKERHLILDNNFDIFERASYGHGCEIQSTENEKHIKLCYLGYGSPAKLLPLAIRKVITVPSELECKEECIRLRETTAFKCYAFSYGFRKTTFNCEMSDCDQTGLKFNIHYTHTDERDYWLFAWNPFDYTCWDKINTIGGSRVNNNRRMDIFKEPDVAWRHYSVSGKPCRRNSPCGKNIITGFYSCEIEGSEISSWDYCCKVDHPCGYSQGFDYPWCFVGDGPEQWRKCSDRYYPRNHTLTHSRLNVKKLQTSDKHKPTDSFTSASISNEYQKPPLPGGLQGLSDFTAARLWPVTYLYSEGPPNATEFSNFVDCNKETC